MILLHPSSIASIMPEPRTKGEGILSKGAQTYLNGLAKQHVYGFREELNTKPIQKGRMCEQDSIDLLNSLFFTFHVKNTERRKNEWITGEADIVADDCIHDIKSSWSLATFPATPEEGHNDVYEWQLRSYMWLWDKPRAEIDYCLVDTPEELVTYEQADLHFVSHLPANMRITIVKYEREAEKEARMIEKCKAAHVYLVEQVERIKAAHNY